jgi:transposase
MRPHVVDAAPLIRGLCDQLELVRIVDEMVAWDPSRARLSPGERILALVLAMFMRQRPLYRVHESFRRTDVELLLGQGVTFEDLNDDALGHALDKLSAAGGARVFSAVCARAALLDQVDHRFLHWDSTTRSFYGEYDEAAPSGLRVTHGYSKDKRPDLKQIVLSLLANREGIPYGGTVESGNASDKKLNGEVLDRIVEAFSPERLGEMVYVADSAFCTEANLAKAAAMGLKILSRLPENFTTATAQAKDRAFETEEWVDLGPVASRRHAASYQASEQEGEIGGRPYRLVVLRSDHLERRKERALEKELAERRQVLEAEAKELTRHPFACVADAEAAADQWLHHPAGRLHLLSATVTEPPVRVRRPGPGRPRKDEAPVYRTEVRLELKVVGPDPEAVKAERLRRSAFILITTLPKEQATAKDLLIEYKHQASLERRFAFMKDPEIVDSFFLKKPERVEALGYVLLMVCLLFSLLERRVRHDGRPLPTLSRGDLPNPTGLEILRNLSVSVVELDDGTRVLGVHPGFERVFEAILSMARVDPAVYTVIRPRPPG